MFLNGHHSKLSLEYRSTQNMYNNSSDKPDRLGMVILQAQVFL
jgi:hypothetical protein